MSEFPWERWFAVIPVTVDAYQESERRNGKFSYSVALQWVERQWVPRQEREDDDPIPAHWRYRLPQASARP